MLLVIVNRVPLMFAVSALVLLSVDCNVEVSFAWSVCCLVCSSCDAFSFSSCFFISLMVF